jgi:ribosomal protein S18 acetylase RimI-like enzyme
MTSSKIPRLRVRPYEPTDEDVCTEICRSGVPEYFSLADLQAFREFLRKPQGAYYVASYRGRICACGGYYVGADGIAGLTWGMVHADDHRRGFGSQLLRYRLDRLREDDRAWGVRIHTTPAVSGFFERFGFVQEAIVEDGYGPGLDQVTMRLTWREAPVVA